MWAMDVVGPIQTSDISANKYIVTVSDTFSKRGAASIISQKTGENIRNFLQNIGYKV